MAQSDSEPDRNGSQDEEDEREEDDIDDEEPGGGDKEHERRKGEKVRDGAAVVRGNGAERTTVTLIHTIYMFVISHKDDSYHWTKG